MISGMSDLKLRHHLANCVMGLAFWVFIIGAFWLVERMVPTPTPSGVMAQEIEMEATR